MLCLAVVLAVLATRLGAVATDVKGDFTLVSVMVQRITGGKKNGSWKKCMLPNLFDVVGKTAGATLIQFSLVTLVLARHELPHPIKTG